MRLTQLFALGSVFGTLALAAVAPAQSRSRDDRTDSRYDRRDDRSRRDPYDRVRGSDRGRAEDRYRDDRYRDNRYRADARYDNRYNSRDDRRGSASEWRNIAIASGVVGIIGLLDHDNTLTFAGAAGALYAIDRYEHDRRSHDDRDRARYAYFSRNEFTRNGDRYERHEVNRGGQRYYQFVRCR